MKAEELRIGNLVQFDSVCRVYEIQQNCFYVMNEEEISLKNTTCDLQPIPLTEEWLLRFGFEKKDFTWTDKSVSKGLFFKGNYFIIAEEEGFLLCELRYNREQWFIKNMDYVHELQNGWHFLNNEELTFSHPLVKDHNELRRIK